MITAHILHFTDWSAGELHRPLAEPVPWKGKQGAFFADLTNAIVSQSAADDSAKHK